MSINVNAYIRHCHDHAASSHMEGYTGKISEILNTNPNKHLVDKNKKTRFIEVIITNDHLWIIAYIHHCHDNTASSCMEGILGKSVKLIPNAIPNGHLVDYNKKTTFIEVIIINKYWCKCIQTPLIWQSSQQPHDRTYWENQSSQFCMPSPMSTL